MGPNQKFSSSTNGFQNTMVLSDISMIEIDDELERALEVDSAICECCGMCEECSKEYIRSVRNMFSGKLICGLCAEAVNVEMEKNGGVRDKAVQDHMTDCIKFNTLATLYPALYRAQDVKHILKKTQKPHLHHSQTF
ncbi:hypothetical protein VNO78_01137 [Psophocarpus tetragonolobus]|uniref:Uncharacterized protein n=1 Tax=Psophocarpus tetragonolobus TaxID=3891 RepID=A0AAN9SXP5_PSOTE